MSKVLDVEGALEARGKEPAKGRDKRSEASQHEDMVLIWRVRDSRELMAGLSWYQYTVL